MTILKNTGTHSNANALLTTEQAAKILGVTEATLCVWRSTKRYPIPYVKVGRLVRYRTDDLNAFIEQRTQNISNYEDDLF